jgi:hypothetical protein
MPLVKAIFISHIRTFLCKGTSPRPLQRRTILTLPVHPRAKALGFLGTHFYKKLFRNVRNQREPIKSPLIVAKFKTKNPILQAGDEKSLNK